MDEQGPPSVVSDRILRYNAEEEWATIDWMRSQHAALEAERQRHLRSASQAELFVSTSTSQDVMSAILVGAILGCLGIFVDACSRFVLGMRNGLCVNYFWLTKEQCCYGLEENCDGYLTWGEYFSAGTRHVVFTDLVYYMVVSTIVAVSAAFLCKVYCPYAAGGGINEVKTIVSGHQRTRYLGGWTLATKVIATILSTSSGLVVGKEGPFVHIGACVGYIVANLFPDFNHFDAKRRELITAGAAGGIAVAFGAPIGGVLFSIEEISSFNSLKTMLQGLICGVTAVLVVKRVDIFHTGRIVQFSIIYQHSWHWFELPLFVVVGVVGGALGSLVSVANIRWGRVRRQHFMQWRIAEVVVLIAVSALIQFFIPLIRGGMLELLGDLFQDCTPDSPIELCNHPDLYTMVFLIIGALIKLVLLTLTVGSLVPAGILVPSLCTGAMLGRAFGITVDAFQKSYGSLFIFSECFEQSVCVIPAAYAIVGGAALLTGVTRITISLAVIVFELTGGIEYLVPAIIAIFFAKWTGELLGVESLLELGLEESKLPYLDPKKEFHETDVTSEIYAGHEFYPLLATGMTIADINALFEGKVFTGYPVVQSREDPIFIGYVFTRDLRQILVQLVLENRNLTLNTPVSFVPSPNDATVVDCSSVVESSTLQVEPKCSVAMLLMLFKSLGISRVIVTEFSRFRAVVTKKDLINFMRRVEHAEMEEAREALHHFSTRGH